MNLSWALVDSEDFIWRRHDGFRNLNGLDRRIAASKTLLSMHSQFYRNRPEARSWRQYRIGVMELKAKRLRSASGWAIRSFFSRPSARSIRLMIGIAADPLRSRRSRPVTRQEVQSLHTPDRPPLQDRLQHVLHPPTNPASGTTGWKKRSSPTPSSTGSPSTRT